MARELDPPDPLHPPLEPMIRGLVVRKREKICGAKDNRDGCNLKNTHVKKNDPPNERPKSDPKAISLSSNVGAVQISDPAPQVPRYVCKKSIFWNFEVVY